jgi:hypothetical protein
MSHSFPSVTRYGGARCALRSALIGMTNWITQQPLVDSWVNLVNDGYPLT